MKNQSEIIFNKGGTEERTEQAKNVVIPDLWHVKEFLESIGQPEYAEMVNDCWHKANDMKRHIIENS